jgi:hypothetical protein
LGRSNTPKKERKEEEEEEEVTPYVAAEVVQLDFVFGSQPFPSFEKPGRE